jgi:hypothetical protein
LLIVIDMNDPIVLDLYRRLCVFEANPSENEVLFSDPDRGKQWVLCSLAHDLKLQYEYRLDERQAKVSKPRQAYSVDIEMNMGEMQMNQWMIEDLLSRLGDSALGGAEVRNPAASFDSLHFEEFTAPLPVTRADEASSEAVRYNSFSNTPGKDVSDPGVFYHSFSEEGYHEPLTTCPPSINRFTTSSTGRFASHSDRDQSQKLSSRKSSADIASKLSSKGLGFNSQLSTAATQVSASPGRRGPLSEEAIEKSKAIRDNGGACWRCRIFHKSVRYSLNPHNKGMS